MAYADALLVSGETVLRREQQHWILPFYIAGRWVAVAVVVGIASLLVNWLVIPPGGGGILGTIAGFVGWLLAVITVAAFAIAVAGLVWAFARWRAQEYVLTNQRVIHVSGVVTKRSSDSVLETLSDAQIDVPLLGRLMGWGNLVLMTANESGDAQMLALRDPVAFKKAVLGAKTARMVELSPAGIRAAAAAAAVVPSAAVPPTWPSPGTAPAAPSSAAALSAPAAPSPAASSAAAPSAPSPAASSAAAPSAPSPAASSAAAPSAPPSALWGSAAPTAAASAPPAVPPVVAQAPAPPAQPDAAPPASPGPIGRPASARSTSRAGRPSTAADDVARTLTALAGLRDSGTITAEEYETKKQELLDRL